MLWYNRHMKCEWHLCENELSGRQKKFCGTKCKNKSNVTTHRQRMKRKLVEYFGGECVRCGYSKTYAALQFHHHNDDKDFGVAAKGITLSWDRALAEASKCQLICANCHAEEHGNQ